MEDFLNWKRSRPGLLVSAAAEAGLAYLFASLAIDSGSAWHYALTIVLAIGTVVSLVKAVRYHGPAD